MAYEIRHTISFDDINDVPFIVELSRLEVTPPLEDPIQLTPTARPFTIKYKTSDDEHAYPPFILSEATIEFYNEDGNAFDIASLASGDYFEWRCTLKHVTTGNIMWQGFLDIKSCQENLEDYPTLIQLKATDGIALLKNLPFAEGITAPIYGKRTLRDCIAIALQKTGLELPMIIAVNIFEESMADRGDSEFNDPLSQVVVHTRSFMKDGNKFKSCYEVIEAIMLSFNCTFTQALGEWHVIRFPDRWWNTTHGYYASVIPYPYIGYSAIDWRAFNYNFVIAPDGTLATTNFFINADATREYISPVKNGVSAYPVNVPEDLPTNKNWRYGAANLVLGSATKHYYYVDNWIYYKRVGGIYNTPVATPPFRVEEFDAFGKLLEQYVELAKDVIAITDNLERFTSDYIEVQAGDRFTYSFSTREKDNRTGYTGAENVAAIQLIPDGGGAHLWLDDNGKWITFNNFIKATYTAEETNQWHDVILDQNDDIPANGLMLIHFYEWSWANPGNLTFIKDFHLDFEYRLAGSSGLTAIEARSLQAGTYRDEYEREQILADSPKKIWTGALFRYTDMYTLTTWWYQYPVAEQKQLIAIIARDLMKLGNRVRSKVTASFSPAIYTDPRDGTSPALISPINRMLFYLPALANKYCVPSDITIDVQAASGSITAAEIMDTATAESGLTFTESIQYLF